MEAVLVWFALAFVVPLAVMVFGAYRGVARRSDELRTGVRATPIVRRSSRAILVFVTYVALLLGCVVVPQLVLVALAVASFGLIWIWLAPPQDEERDPRG